MDHSFHLSASALYKTPESKSVSGPLSPIEQLKLNHVRRIRLQAAGAMGLLEGNESKLSPVALNPIDQAQGLDVIVVVVDVITCRFR